MCLLVFDFDPRDQVALVVGANRDERLARPATPFAVLADGPRRVLGGRDLLAGGTWLALNDRGVVVGLTNRPSPDGPDPARASRGALPLLAASAPSADAAVEALLRDAAPGTYNAAWLLVADRRSLHYVAVGDHAPKAVALPAGRHVLENRPLDEPSPKVDRVHELLGRSRATDGSLRRVLADHVIGVPEAADSGGASLRRRALASCVHAPTYGTRCATVVVLERAGDAPPRCLVAEGHPCVTPFRERTGLWAAAPQGDATAA